MDFLCMCVSITHVCMFTLNSVVRFLFVSRKRDANKFSLHKQTKSCCFSMLLRKCFSVHSFPNRISTIYTHIYNVYKIAYLYNTCIDDLKFKDLCVCYCCSRGWRTGDKTIVLKYAPMCNVAVLIPFPFLPSRLFSLLLVCVYFYLKDWKLLCWVHLCVQAQKAYPAHAIQLCLYLLMSWVSTTTHHPLTNVFHLC